VATAAWYLSDSGGFGSLTVMPLTPSFPIGWSQAEHRPGRGRQRCAAIRRPGGSGVPRGQVAGGDTVVGAVAGVAVDGCFVGFLPEDLVVLIEEEQFTDHVEEHL
jgi:hypothetical protein